jgi:hypothetical protein
VFLAAVVLLSRFFVSVVGVFLICNSFFSINICVRHIRVAGS